MQRIGIGITTTSNRPEHLELCLMQIWKHTPELNGRGAHIYIAKDIPTIAKAKNQCLYALRDCDHIFLFDDDCFPIKYGWVEFFIRGGRPHLLYLTDRHKKSKVQPVGETWYDECGGCFMYISKEAFEKVGYFNSEYKQYGFEHAGYSRRINPARASYYPTYIHADKYLYSLDYQGEGNWGIKHKPSITDYKAMQESIDYNRQVFQKEITGDKIYYEYEP